MTAALHETTYTVFRTGWSAQAGDGFVIIYVGPTADVCSAIETLVPADRRHMWVLEAYDSTPDGWDVWILTRE